MADAKQAMAHGRSVPPAQYLSLSSPCIAYMQRVVLTTSALWFTLRGQRWR